MAFPTSGTYGFAPTSGELILYAFAQAGVMRSKIENEHMVNAVMAANLVFSDWANDQPHLWKVQPFSIPLQQGVATYQLPANVILILDSFRRTFQLPTIFNVAPDFSTVINTAAVTIGLVNHGLSAGSWVNLVCPVSVGGLVLLGYYQVATVPNGNAFTITAASVASSTVNHGGAVPTFTSAAFSANITVALANHGQLSGFLWNVEIATTVGGVTLQGSYTVQSVTDANHFVIQALQQAASAQTVAENTALEQFACQSVSVQPTDIILWPIGRSEYDTYPNKTFQAPPTVQWFNRQVAPTLTTYPVADGNGPYEIAGHVVLQQQDVNGTFAEIPDLPYRFNGAFAAELALALANIYSTDEARIARLEKMRDRVLGRAQTQDTEKVPIYIAPQFGSYKRR